jgi:hypothetical protein
MLKLWLIALFSDQVGGTGPLRIGGAPLMEAESEVVIAKEVVEVPGEESETVRLLPGHTVYRLFIDSPRLIPAVEAAALSGAPNPYVDVMVEDGRSFSRCLLESSYTWNGYSRQARERRTRYGLRCEIQLN